MRGNEVVNGSPIRCYDNGGKTADRYTVVYMDRKQWGYTADYIGQTGRDLYPCVGMSALPFHPLGIGQHGECQLGKHLGKRVPFLTLPKDCRKLVEQDTRDEDTLPKRARDYDPNHPEFKRS